jgi:hypothetical protein
MLRPLVSRPRRGVERTDLECAQAANECALMQLVVAQTSERSALSPDFFVSPLAVDPGELP